MKKTTGLCVAALCIGAMSVQAQITIVDGGFSTSNTITTTGNNQIDLGTASLGVWTTRNTARSSKWDADTTVAGKAVFGRGARTLNLIQTVAVGGSGDYTVEFDIGLLPDVNTADIAVSMYSWDTSDTSNAVLNYITGAYQDDMIAKSAIPEQTLLLYDLIADNGVFVEDNGLVASATSGTYSAGFTVSNNQDRFTIIFHSTGGGSGGKGTSLPVFSIDNVSVAGGGGGGPSYSTFSIQYGLVDGPLGDDDDDGVSNLGEYALNGNPTNAADKGQTSFSNDGSTFTYVYASNVVDGALVYRLIDTANLVSGPWNTNAYTSVELGPTLGDYATVTNNYISNDTLFINLKVENN